VNHASYSEETLERVGQCPSGGTWVQGLVLEGVIFVTSFANHPVPRSAMPMPVNRFHWHGRNHSGKDHAMRPLALCLAILLIFPEWTPAQTATTAASDAWRQDLTKAERRIQQVRVEIGNSYERKLGVLRAAFQKMVQVELLGKQKEMLSQIVQESLPKLLELKKALTVSGRLDEALEVRRSIADLQDIVSPAEKVDNGTVVSAEELFQTFQSSRLRADKMYKGRNLVVRGKLAGMRPDPRDPGSSVLVIFGGGEGMFIDCAFSGDQRIGEVRQGSTVSYSISKGGNDANPARLTRGALVEMSGRCEGWDAGVRLGNCSVARR
jgi:hypothetical protein